MSNIVPRHLRYEQVTTEDQVIVRRAGVHLGRLLARTRWRLARYGDRVSIWPTKRCARRQPAPAT